MSKRASVILLVIIIALSCCLSVFFTEKKEGYHCDEIYSHGLSNSVFHYEMYNEDGTIQTIDGIDE